MSSAHPGMNCPVCNVNLVMSERQGIEIDYCPQCRGVWLDRGELDKIIERSSEDSAPRAAAPAPQPQAPPQPSHPSPTYPQQSGYGQQPGYDRGHAQDHYRYKRKKSWLEEIFD